MPDVSMAKGTSSEPRCSELVIRGVSKSFGGTPALSDVSMTFGLGRVVAVLGENGAGKSTLIKILGGQVRADTGEFELGGVPLKAGARSELAAAVGVVQQELSIIQSLSVAENVLFGTDRGWRRPRTARRLALAPLAAVGLADLDPGLPAASLSLAEQQLVEIARVLYRDPSVMIFDEPTAALSDSEIDRVHQVVRRLAAQGKGVIYVSHRLHEIMDLCDEVQVLRNGRATVRHLVSETTVDELVREMLGRPLEQMYPPRVPADGALRLQVEEVSSSDGSIDRVSLTAARGEILALAGQLGSGASIALRAIAGQIPLASGTVAIDGTPVAPSARAARSAGIAYISEDRKRDGVFLGQSVRTNLTSTVLNRVSRGGWISRSAEDALAGEAAAAFAIESARLGSLVGLLSGGNQQKVVLGKWEAVQPRLLLIDEPTRGVDIGARAEIYTSLRRMAAGGTTILFASSDLAEAIGLADRVVSWYRGAIVDVSPSESLTEESLLARLVAGQAGRMGPVA